MPDSHELRVQPTLPAGAAEALHNYGSSAGQATPLPGGQGRRAAERHPDQVALTTGKLRPAYTEFVVDPETHEVSVSIRDATTDQVISQIPSPEMISLSKSLRAYADALALRHAAAQAHKEGA